MQLETTSYLTCGSSDNAPLLLDSASSPLWDTRAPHWVTVSLFQGHRRPNAWLCNLESPPQHLVTSIMLTSRTHREANSEHWISQWWGHCKLHQDEVLECLTMEEIQQVSPNNVDYWLTTVSTSSTLPNHPRSQVHGTLFNDPMKPLLVHSLAAFKGNKKTNDPYKPSIAPVLTAFKGYDSEDSSSSVTIVALSRATSHTVGSCWLTRALSTALATLSLPNHKSYAQHLHLILNYIVQEEPPPIETSSLGRWTLASRTPGNTQPCIYPDGQLILFKQGACQQTIPSSPFMSSATPSTGDSVHQNKTHSTNNSASWNLITLLTTRRKGKGVSMTEELDPEADSPVNISPMPASGPVLTGPHPLDTTNLEEVSLSPAAPQSMKWMLTASRSMSTQPAAPKSVTHGCRPMPYFLD